MKKGSKTEEVRRLQGCVNDLVSLLALPAMWSGREPSEPSQVAGTLLDALLSMLRLDLVYARLNDPGGNSPFEAVRFAGRRKMDDQPREVGRAVESWLTHDPPASRRVMPHPVGTGEVTVARFWLGLEGEMGILVAGSERADFPTEIETLLLKTAANQAAIALEGVRLLSERKRAEEAARRTQQELSDFVENAAVGLHWVGPDGIILWANRAELEMLGYQREEYIGRHIAEFHAEPPVIEDILRRLAQGQTLHEYPARLRCKDGSIRDVLINSNVFWEEGEFVHTRCFTSDVTERKQIEEAVRRRTAQFETLLNEAPLGVYLVDADFRIRQVNPKALPVFGDLPDLIDRDFGEVIHILWPKAYADEVIERFRHTLETGEPYIVPEQIEERLDRGVTEFYEWQINRIPLPDGRYGVVCYFRDISAQVFARRKIQESAERLRFMSESMPQKIFTARPNGEMDYFNRQWTEFTGLSFEQIKDWGWTQFIHPEDVKENVRVWQESIDTGEPFQFEHRFRRADGIYRWHLSRAHAMRDREGRVLLWLGSNTDIDDMKRAEKALAERARLAALAADVGTALTQSDTLPEMLHHSAEAMVRHLDAAFARIWTLNTEEQVLELHASAGMYTHLDGPHARVPVGKYKIGLIAAERTPHLTNDVQRDPRVSDQEWAKREGMVAFAGYPLIVEDRLIGVMAMFSRQSLTEAALEAMSSVANGIALGIERKRAETDLREQTEVVETINRVGQTLAAELDLHKLVQTVTDAATELTDARFGSFFYNVTGERGASYMLYTLSGVEREAFAHFPMPRATDLFGPTFRGEGVVRIADVKKDPRYGKNSPYFGMPEGHLPVTSYLAVSVISRSGEVLGGLFFGHPEAAVFTERDEALVTGLAAQAAIAMDNARLYEVAQRERAEAERLYREAEQASRLKDEFLATVSHELRTPLTAIIGWSSMLRGGKLDETNTANALETIERNAKVQQQLIEDLMDVSRIITGKLRLDVRPVELLHVVEAAVESVHPTADAKNIRVQAVLDPLAGPVSGDATRLQQVVWNLLSNAIKFTPKGGRVQVRLERVNSHVEIIVSDTGQGIRPDFLHYVFDRFRQADGTTTRKHAGLGLGLAIVRHLVELHGGAVLVDSGGEGEGATFTVQLPLMIVHREVGSDERRHPTAESTGETLCPPALDGLRVLIVDDELDARNMLTVILKQCQAEVMAVASAAEALAALEHFRPDVLVSDIGMPEEDGYALIRKVRALLAERGGRIPAAALTAYAGAEDRKRALLAGFQVHLPKPVDPIELVAVVASLAGRTGKF